MDQARSMRAVQSTTQLNRHPDHVVGTQRALGGQPGIQRRPLQQLHDQVQLPLGGLPKVVHGDHIGMIETTGLARLIHEALHRGRIPCGQRMEELDRHFAIDPVLLRSVDNAHPTAAQPVQ
ncbi:MAG: hypothetical protein ACI9WU_004182 [Myxococcota bacterium]|jgi:hypothetical protein